MASTNYKEHSIINGPSKFDLTISNFHGDNYNRVVVKFQLAKGSGAWLDVVIDGNDREDGSGENWLFRGFVVVGKEKDGLIKLGPRFNAFYSLKNRSGWIRIDKTC